MRSGVFKYNGRRSLVALSLVLAVVAAVSASEPFRGTLVNYKGKPIKNAKIYVHDPKKSVKTNNRGEFKIKDVEPDDTIHIQYQGDIHDIPVNGSAGMYIKINRRPMKGGDELVNMGAGGVRARDYNGPRSVRTAKQLEATGESDLIKAMIGMPSVSINYGPKETDSKPRISIRNSGFSPLWIVSGVEMQEPPDGLSVMEVEKVEVLSDGALYGTRGAGGVIIVTLKGDTF